MAYPQEFCLPNIRARGVARDLNTSSTACFSGFKIKITLSQTISVFQLAFTRNRLHNTV